MAETQMENFATYQVPLAAEALVAGATAARNRRPGAALSRRRGEKDDGGARYYEYGLAALEKWDRAARATPHGKPIVLPGQ